MYFCLGWKISTRKAKLASIQLSNRSSNIPFFLYDKTNAQRRRCNQMRYDNKIKPLLVSKERENGIASKAMTLPKNNNIASDIH